MIDLQFHIGLLSKQGLIEEAFNLMDEYSFSIINRVLSIHQYFKKGAKTAPGVDGALLLNESDCLRMLEETKLFRATKLRSSVIKRVYIPKKSSGERPLGLGNIIDRVLQRMMVNLVEPYYESKYYYDMYGFRRGRSQVQAVAQLYMYMSKGMATKNVIFLDIKGFFDNISHEFLKEIRVPSLFRNLTNV